MSSWNFWLITLLCFSLGLIVIIFLHLSSQLEKEWRDGRTGSRDNDRDNHRDNHRDNQPDRPLLRDPDLR